MIEVQVRSPTGRAWMMFLIGFIGAGEILFEVRKAKQATFFNMPFTDGELIPWIVLLGLVSAIGLVWLARLYLFPGRLILDSEAGVVRRLQRLMLRTRTIEAPASEWTVRISYFSADHRERGVFKRALLIAPDFSEVLLFSDCQNGEGFAKNAEAMRDQLGELRIDVESEAATG